MVEQQRKVAESTVKHRQRIQRERQRIIEAET